MLDISRDIHSLTDFKKNTSEFVNPVEADRRAGRSHHQR